MKVSLTLIPLTLTVLVCVSLAIQTPAAVANENARGAGTPVAQKAQKQKTRYMGTQGSDIKAVQKKLNSVGCRVAAYGAGSPGQETNYFGTKTKQALKCYQKKKGLSQTGDLDDTTYRELMREIGDAVVPKYEYERETCLKAGGVWLKEYGECNLTKARTDNPEMFCTNTMKGTYNECASPCRHEENAGACAAVCERICTASPKTGYPGATEKPHKGAQPVTLKDKADACEDADGVWLPAHKECELQNVADDHASFCTDTLKGTYNACASACRNDPDAQFCTLQCVPVCAVSTSAQPTTPTTSAPKEKAAQISALRAQIKALQEQIRRLLAGQGN